MEAAPKRALSFPRRWWPALVLIALRDSASQFLSYVRADLSSLLFAHFQVATFQLATFIFN